jgi:hypothetical protein
VTQAGSGVELDPPLKAEGISSDQIEEEMPFLIFRMRASSRL